MIHSFPTYPNSPQVTRAPRRAQPSGRLVNTKRTGAVTTSARHAAFAVRQHLRARTNAAAAPAGVGELAFSLKLPKFIRNAASSVAKSVGIKAQVSTPAGPVIVDTRDPDSLKRAADAARELLTRTTVSVGPREQASAPTPANFVESSIPGGWLTVGVLGIGGLLALKQVMR